MMRSTANTSISRTRSVSACCSISAISANRLSAIVIAIWFKASQSEPNPKIDGDRKRLHRLSAALRRGLRALPPIPTVGTQPLIIIPYASVQKDSPCSVIVFEEPHQISRSRGHQLNQRQRLSKRCTLARRANQSSLRPRLPQETGPLGFWTT